jgi:hypothetical protein
MVYSGKFKATPRPIAITLLHFGASSLERAKYELYSKYVRRAGKFRRRDDRSMILGIL